MKCIVFGGLLESLITLAGQEKNNLIALGKMVLCLYTDMGEGLIIDLKIISQAIRRFKKMLDGPILPKSLHGNAAALL